VNILHLCRTLRLAGGVETYLRRLVEEQSRHGHRLLVVAGEGPERPWNGQGVEYRVVADSHKASAGRKPRDQVLARAEEFVPDLVHAHETINFELALALAGRYPLLKHAHVDFACAAGGRRFFRRSRRACVRKLGPGCLWHYYAAPCGPAANPLCALRGYRRAREAVSTWAGAAGLIANSEHVRRSLVAAGLPAGRVHRLHYFVPNREAESGHPLAGERREILYVGRILPDKGPDDLLRALALAGNDLALTVVGDGISKSDSEELSRKLGLSDRVEFAGWQEDVEPFYRRAALLVVPSLWPEPFGIVGIEAMARALPVVAYRSGGIPEWLDDGVTGTLVEPGDIPGLARAIDEVVSDPEGARRMGRAGQERQRELFSPEPHMKRLEEIYLEAIESFRSP